MVSLFLASIDQDHIRLIPFGSQGLLDTLRWMPNKKEIFSIKSTYWFSKNLPSQQTLGSLEITYQRKLWAYIRALNSIPGLMSSFGELFEINFQPRAIYQEEEL